MVHSTNQYKYQDKVHTVTATGSRDRFEGSLGTFNMSARYLAALSARSNPSSLGWVKTKNFMDDTLVNSYLLIEKKGDISAKRREFDIQ